MESTVAVFVDGACRHNGNPELAQASWTCFFGPGSKFNKSGRVVDSGDVDDVASSRQTSQVAEISAAIEALKAIDNEVRKDVECGEVVIVTDLDYVVQAMTKHVYK